MPIVLTVPVLGNYTLMGYAGNDTLIGSKVGSSTLVGGLGNDSYNLYNAADVLVENAGEGTDTIYSYINYTLGANFETGKAMASGLTLYGNALDNSLSAAAGGSILYGEAGNDTVQGAAGNDKLYGNDGVDRLIGNDGNDWLDGGLGNDILTGGNGADTLLGGDGNDSIEGGTGLDVLTGGFGTDTFIFRPTDFTGVTVAAAKDIITDFAAVQGDKIAINGIDAKSATTADDAFTFIGSQAFRNIAGELRYTAETDGITVYGDTNGDSIADFGIHLTGITSILATNFIL